MINLGVAEILVLLIIAGLTIGVPLAIVGIAFLISRRSSYGPTANWKSSGHPVPVRVLSNLDKPLAPSARWDGSELVVAAGESSTKSLFEVPLPNLEQCVISYRFRISADNLRSAVYPEMWCRVPEKGQFFSRGLNQKILGSANGTEVEIPFFLQTGQRADLLQLNLVFEGPGVVRLKNIEVLSTALNGS